jgi:hypothetical protein
MALTISAAPARQWYPESKFTITTSLVEGASYNNVRIRASIMVNGEIISIIEQPKGLDIFDFTNILKSYCGKFEYDFKSSTKIITPIAASTNLFTGVWVNVSSTFSTFSSASELLVSGTAGGSTSYCRSTAFSYTKGDIICLNFTEGSTIPASINVYLHNSTSSLTGYFEGVSVNTRFGRDERMIYLSADVDIATAYIWISVPASGGSFNFTVRTFKVTAAQMNTYNNPVAYYRAYFSEYYEDSSGVTTIGSTTFWNTMLFVPMQIQPSSISSYLLKSNTSLFCSESVGIQNVTKHFKYNKSYTHIRVLALPTKGYTPDLRTSIDGAGFVSNTFYHAGWFIVNIELESFLTPVNSKFIFFYQSESTQFSNEHEIELTSKCFPFPVQIDFKGKLGNEFIVLNGNRKKSIKNLEPEKYKNKYGVGIPISSQNVVSIEAQTNFQSEDYFNLLGELINTDKMPELIVENDTNYDFNYCVPVQIDETEIITNSDESPINAEVKITYYPYV